MSEAEASAQYIVRALPAVGGVYWIARPFLGDYRGIGPRDNAAIFRSRSAAESAIDKMPGVYKHSGFLFSIEQVD